MRSYVDVKREVEVGRTKKKLGDSLHEFSKHYCYHYYIITKKGPLGCKAATAQGLLREKVQQVEVHKTFLEEKESCYSLFSRTCDSWRHYFPLK